MPNLSSNVIELRKSKNYKRLAFIIAIFTVFMIVDSSLPLIMQVVCILALSINHLYIVHNPRPTNPYSSIVCLSDEIVLQTLGNECHYFSKRKLIMANSLFYLFQFTSAKTTKHLVVFTDQISKEQCRLVIIGPKLAFK